MDETAFQWAKRQFGSLASELLNQGFKQGGANEFIRATGERRIQVVVRDDVRQPHIRVVNEPLPNLAVWIDDTKPEPSKVEIRFDAVLLGTEYGWVERGGVQGMVTNDGIISQILRVVATA